MPMSKNDIVVEFSSSYFKWITVNGVFERWNKNLRALQREFEHGSNDASPKN